MAQGAISGAAPLGQDLGDHVGVGRRGILGETPERAHWLTAVHQDQHASTVRSHPREALVCEARDVVDQPRAERDRRAQIIDAEGSKRAAVLQAEGIQQSQITTAEGQKQSQILEAEGDAQSRIRRAQGEAEAIRLVTEAIKGAKADPTNYLIAMKYLETLKEMTSGQNNKVIYMPYEATGVLSSVGGIKEMLDMNRKG